MWQFPAFEVQVADRGKEAFRPWFRKSPNFAGHAATAESPPRPEVPAGHLQGPFAETSGVFLRKV